MMSQEHSDVEPEEDKHQELEDDREFDPEDLQLRLASDPEVVQKRCKSSMLTIPQFWISAK